MFKLLINLILKASLLCLAVCALSLVAEANTGAKIIQLKSTRAYEAPPVMDLKTMAQSIEVLRKSSDDARQLKQSGASEAEMAEAKQNILAAINTFGSYQFPSGYLERSEIDKLIVTLLSAYPVDSDVTNAVTKKLAELSHTIFSRNTGDSFLRFLNYQMELQLPASRPQDWPRFLSLLEASKPHSSQMDMLTLFFKKTTDPEVKLRAFNQIYHVLIDPDLHWSGQFSPTFLILSALRTFIADDLSNLKPEHYMKILDLMVKVENTKQIDPMSQDDLTRIMMNYAEIRIEFEEKIILRANSLSHYGLILGELSKQVDSGKILTPVQENLLRKLKLKTEEHILTRQTLLGELKRGRIIPFRRAAPTCHSFYGGN